MNDMHDICRMTFLFVEDDIEIRTMVKYFFSKNYVNQKLFFAEDGYDGLRMSIKHQPDLFMVDLSLPLMDGFSFMKEIFLHNRSAEVIVVSVNSDVDTVKKCLDIGAKYYVTKPINFENFFEKIDSMMERIFWKRLSVARGRINYGKFVDGIDL